MVEHWLPKPRVAGSIPVSRSNNLNLVTGGFMTARSALTRTRGNYDHR
jgi:hypothetical protein